MKSELRNITYTSAPGKVSMTDCWYDLASMDHFWIRRRFKVCQRLADPLIRAAASVAEVGCGNGLVQRDMEDRYGIAVTGFELNDLALQKNVSRISPLHCYDIHQRAPEFRAKFDLILLFDVLEHIENESAFLQSLRYHLTDTGSMVVNVPAHQFLYSAYDREQGHFRRYSIRQFERVAQQNGLKIRSISCWGLPLSPVLLVRKAILAFKQTEQEIISTGFDPGGRVANYCLGLLSRCEPLPQQLFGTSIMAVLDNQV
jgi:SAM-dependent methyltransferase